MQLSVCVCVLGCVCMHVCMSVCDFSYVCIHVCLCVCVCVDRDSGNLEGYSLPPSTTLLGALHYPDTGVVLHWRGCYGCVCGCTQSLGIWRDIPCRPARLSWEHSTLQTKGWCCTGGGAMCVCVCVWCLLWCVLGGVCGGGV